MEELLNSFLFIISPTPLLLVTAGTIFGIVFGAIPGLTATLAVILLIPTTYGMSPSLGICMLVGVYIGGVSGGLVSAILLGMPGTPASLVTGLDGFPMAKRGEGGRALGIGITSNLVGCFLGGICLVTLAPFLARFAIKFGAVENAAVLIFGFTTVISLAGDSLLKGFIMLGFGLAVSTIGIDPINSTERNTLELAFLSNGVDSMPALIGLFVVSQALLEMDSRSEKFIIERSGDTKNRFMRLSELRESLGNFLRSSVIGTAIGILPGIGGSLSGIVAYDQAQKASKEPESFGKGNYQGIVASETSNNAAVAGALIPFLALGIPGDSVTAALMGGLQIHGLDPGPVLFSQHYQMISDVFIAFFFASGVMFLFMMLCGTYIFPIILRVQKKYILPLVLVFSLIGCYNMNYTLSAVWVAIIFGIVGYFLKKFDYPAVPLVIGIILGPMFERQLRIAMIQTDGSLLPFVTEAIPATFILLAAASFCFALFKRRLQAQKKTAA
ncbi:MAG: hypothetical protein DELT_00844 [Desulfovibrio sp.]